jgi:hypothetical protein
MPRSAIPLPEWIPQACELMVKYDLSLRQAAAELGKNISIEEAEALKDRKLFKEAMESARLADYTELGSDSKINKDAVVGQMYKLAGRLTAEHEDYKAADTLLKICKAMGWTGESEQKSEFEKWFRSLTQSDIDALKAANKRKIEELEHRQAQPKQQTAKVN